MTEFTDTVQFLTIGAAAMIVLAIGGGVANSYTGDSHFKAQLAYGALIGGVAGAFGAVGALVGVIAGEWWMAFGLPAGMAGMFAAATRRATRRELDAIAERLRR